MLFFKGDAEGSVKMPRLRTASGRGGGGGRLGPEQNVTCIAAAGNIAMSPGISQQLAISTDAGTSRLLSAGNNGITGQLDFINTATNVIIATLAAQPFLPDPPAYATVNQTFWVPKLDGINNDIIRRYTKDGVFVAEVTPSPGNAYGTHIAYEPTTARIWGLPFDPANAVVYDINPATNAVTLHVVVPLAGATGPAQLFASPGFIYVNSWTPDYNNNIFHVLNSATLVEVGTIDLSIGAGGFDGGFCYSSTTGKVYFSYLSGANVSELWEVTPATAAIAFKYTPLANRIMGLDADPFGLRLVGVDGVSGTGTVIDPVARIVICTPAITPDAGFVAGVAIDGSAAGRIYFVNNSANRILRYT